MVIAPLLVVKMNWACKEAEDTNRRNPKTVFTVACLAISFIGKLFIDNKHQRQTVNLREDFAVRIFPQYSEQKPGLATVDRSEFAMNGTPMPFQRAGRDPQLLGDYLVGTTVASSLKDFLLPLRQHRQFLSFHPVFHVPSADNAPPP